MVLFVFKPLSLVVDTFEFIELFLVYCDGIKIVANLNEIVAGCEGANPLPDKCRRNLKTNKKNMQDKFDERSANGLY